MCARQNLQQGDHTNKRMWPFWTPSQSVEDTPFAERREDAVAAANEVIRRSRANPRNPRPGGGGEHDFANDFRVALAAVRATAAEENRMFSEMRRHAALDAASFTARADALGAALNASKRTEEREQKRIADECEGCVSL